MTQIPLYHRSKMTGEFINIDDHFRDVLLRVRWSTGDIRRPQSPRYVARFHGEPFTISLNRVIYALAHNPTLLERDIFGHDLGLLKYGMSQHPPLVFEDGNVLNCTLANIIPRALSRKGQRPRDVDSTPLEPSPPLSQSDVTVFSQAQVMVQYGEKGVGKSELVPSPLANETKDADLSKLFSHLDASRDASISRTNDINKKGP